MGFVLVIAISVRSTVGDHDHDRMVVESGDLAGQVAEDTVLVIDLRSEGQRTRNAEFSRIILTVEQNQSRLDLTTAVDDQGEPYDRCGTGECLWVELDCSEDGCASRSILPMPYSFAGSEALNYEIALVVQAEWDLQVVPQLLTWTDLGLTPPTTE